MLFCSQCGNSLPLGAHFCSSCGNLIEPEDVLLFSAGVRIFFSYAHRDKALRDKLEDHLSILKYRGLISTWHDREIDAGEEWAEQIDIHLGTAHLILLLISSNFIASKYCYSIEMKHALERHNRKEAWVIPILLRPVHFSGAPFAKLQMLPANAQPVTNWRNRDSAFVNIAMGIERLINLHFKPTHDENTSTTDTLKLTGPAKIVQVPVAGQPGRYITGLLPVLPEQTSQPPAHRDVRKNLARISHLILDISKYLIAGLLVFGLLAGSIFLLSQYPNFIPLVVGIALGLIVLAIIIQSVYTISMIRREQAEHEAARRREREEREAARREAARRFEWLSEREYYESALIAYEKALRADPIDGKAYRGKGNALNALERYSAAYAAFTRAVCYDSHAAAYSGMGNALSHLKRYDEALAAYQQAIDLDSTFASAYYEMAQVLEHLGRNEDAQQAYEKAEQLGYSE